MSRIQIEVREEILHTWCTVKGITFNQIAKRVGVAPASVKAIIEKFGMHHTLTDLPRSGRKPGASDPKLDKYVVKLINQNKSISMRDLAKKAGTSYGMIQRIKRRYGLKRRNLR